MPSWTACGSWPSGGAEAALCRAGPAHRAGDPGGVFHPGRGLLRRRRPLPHLHGEAPGRRLPGGADGLPAGALFRRARTPAACPSTRSRHSWTGWWSPPTGTIWPLPSTPSETERLRWCSTLSSGPARSCPGCTPSRHGALSDPVGGAAPPHGGAGCDRLCPAGVHQRRHAHRPRTTGRKTPGPLLRLGRHGAAGPPHGFRHRLPGGVLSPPGGVYCAVTRRDFTGNGPSCRSRPLRPTRRCTLIPQAALTPPVRSASKGAYAPACWPTSSWWTATC